MSIARKSLRYRLLWLAIGVALASLGGYPLLTICWREVERRAIAEIETGGGKVSDTGEVVLNSKVLGVEFRDLMDRLGIPRRRGWKRIDLSSCIQTDRLFSLTAGISNVAIIDASNSDITDCSASTFEYHSSLRELTLSKTRITGTALLHLRNLRQLERLNLSETAVTDQGLKHLSELARLRDLVLSDVPVTDIGLRAIKPLPSLSSLYLGGTAVSDDGMVYLPPQLEYLELSHTKIGDAGAAKLVGLLSLYGLQLDSSQVTDRSVESLATCPRLHTLSLSRNNLTDQAAESLAKSQSLGIVYLYSSRISKEAIERLQRNRPQLTVVWTP